MKYLIADLVTEFTPIYDYLNNFAKPFIYKGNRKSDIVLNISEDRIKKFQKRMEEGTPLSHTESFLYSNAFNKAAIKYNTMLVHSSALVYKGGAYLFSAESGVGKSTHTRLWQQAFGDKVRIINDDKPVVQIRDSECIVYGTPFDGGSGIANNESAPLKAIVFIERGEHNSVRVPNTSEIIKNLYFSTARMVDKETADSMLLNFEKLIGLTKFYILTCNMDISAAYTARDAIV